MAKKKVFFKLTFISFLFCIQGLAVEAAVVKKMKRSTGLVLIDGGKEAGFKKNEKICFFNFSQVNMGCGRVRKLLSTRAVVKVTSLVASKIEPGFFARTREMESDRQKKGENTFIVSPRLAIYTPILYGASYTNLSGNDAVDTSAKTFFLQDKKGPGGFGFFTGVEVDIRMINLTLGFNFLTLAPPAQLISKDETVTESVRTAYGFSNRFFVDYTYYPHKLFGVGLGIQGNYHSVTVDLLDSDIVDDDSNYGALSYREDKMSFALRVPLSLNVLFKPVGFFLRVTPTFNLFSLNLGSSVLPGKDDRIGFAYPYKKQIEELEKDADYSLQEDIKANLGFSHNIFSLDASLGFLVAF